MLRYKRNLVLDIYDYQGHKICPLYDSTSDLSGQATDVVVTKERNGWKELSFTLPQTYENEQGVQEDNYRTQFLKADYRIRLKDDEGIDWYLISEPKITHSAFSKDIQVKAGHIAQLLKTKNLGLEFSDEEGNNVGTAEELLTTILEGTGWQVGSVADFKEKRGGATKIRSMKASAKTGAFKLISDMCDLFEAKPIYHGEGRTVDIVPMNPFSEPEDGGVPDIADDKKSRVIELHYGKNIKNVTRTLNTENIVTKLYCYGAFGDKVSGYCGIDEWHHQEYKLTRSSDISAGQECKFVVQDPIAAINYTRYFTAKADIPAGTEMIWQILDPASMRYVWDGTNAHVVYEERKTDNPTPLTLSGQEDVVNQFSFIMDFDYYNSIGLLTEDMIQSIAEYQRNMPGYLVTANEAATDFAQALTDLSEVVGSVNFVRLAVTGYSSDEGYLQLTLDTENYPKGVIYRTDYNVRERKQFKWRVATELKPNGDALNQEASIVYIIHTDTDPYTFDIAYLKTLKDENGEVVTPDDDIEKLTLWMEAINYKSTDQIYLFKANTINGMLGALQASDEATVIALDNTTKVVTTKHPVKYSTTQPAVDDFLNFGWWWKYGDEPDDSELFFCYKDLGDTTWKRVAFTDETPSFVINGYWYNWRTAVLYVSDQTQWIAYNDSPEQQRLGAMFGSVYRSCQTRDRNRIGYYQYYTVRVNDELIERYGENGALPVGNYAIEDEYGTYHTFTTKENMSVEENAYVVYDTTNKWFVASSTDPRDKPITKIIDITLEAKDFRFDNVFENSANILQDAYWEEGGIVEAGEYRTDNHIIVAGGGDAGEGEGLGTYRSGYCNAYPGIKYIVNNMSGDTYAFMYTSGNQCLGMVQITSQNNTFVASPYTRHIRFATTNSNYRNMTCGAENADTTFIVDEEAYNIIGSLRVDYQDFPVVEATGRLKGIVPLMKEFVRLSDEAYITAKGTLDAAQAVVKAEDLMLVNALGDMYREGYWQKADYVDGDEEKLYYDGLENLEKISKPDAKYTIQYLDLYGANADNFEYAAHNLPANTYWPDISSDYGAHLVDPEIAISQWAFIDKIQKCYDQPWKTQIQINTDLSTIAQHSFADVMTNIANVASAVNGKMEIYDRAESFDDSGNMSTSNLEGKIDADRLLITGASSTWYTDNKGNMVFESADGSQAMTITGNGFSIANQKNEYGEWNWRTFGTGDGFTADLITAGTVDADRVITSELVGRLNETLSINADHVVISSGPEAGTSIKDYTDWKAQQVEEDMDEKIGYRIEIISTQDILSDDIPVTTLSVRVYQGSENVTDQFSDNAFVWARKSSDASGDRQWSHTGKTLQLRKSDVFFSASYTCNLVQ